MKITIEKSAIPILWLDTAVLIKMAKQRTGEQIGEPDASRVATLYETIYRLTRQQRLLCPAGDQREEYELGDRLVEAIQDLQDQLSLGIEFQHRQGVEDAQIPKAIRDYIEGVQAIQLSYRDGFLEDPVPEAQRLGDFYIVVPRASSREMIDRRRATGKVVRVEWEKLRAQNVADKVPFEMQREREYAGALEGHVHHLRRLAQRQAAGQDPTPDEFLAAQIIGTYLAVWKRRGGQPPELEGLEQFFRSPQFRDLPAQELQANVLAKLLTSPNPIQSGDSMDVQMLSTVLPFCDLIVTDQKMKTILCDLGADRRYQVQIFALRDYDALMQALSEVGPQGPAEAKVGPTDTS